VDSAADLTRNCEALIAHQVDILNVSIDAWTDETFRRVKVLSPPLLVRERGSSGKESGTKSPVIRGFVTDFEALKGLPTCNRNDIRRPHRSSK
jgi:hypothetical protein